MGNNSGIKGGYPGLAFTAFQISEYIPKCKTYVEPFAGMGRLTNFIKAEKIILNDKSKYAYNHLKKAFPDKIITNDDFEKTIIGNDSENTFFLIDPPWAFELYTENKKTFCDRTPKEYYDKILELLTNSKSYFFICGEQSVKLNGYEKYYSKLFISNRGKIFGRPARTKVYSNKPFIRYNQGELDSFL